jgi:hypothetical protein
VLAVTLLWVTYISAVFGAGRFCLQKQQKTVLLVYNLFRLGESGLEKFKLEKILEARKRLDMSSRGSDEEYYNNLFTNLSVMKYTDKMTIIIDGAIDVADNPIPVDEFVDKFIEWIESNNWYFGGMIKGMDNI